jgi:hypothetical protein
MGQIEMKCISNIEKNIFILAKATQVSDVAHGPLVFYHMSLPCDKTILWVIKRFLCGLDLCV